MTIDNTPAIKAWCEQRILMLKHDEPTPSEIARTDELRMLITLCDGLAKQNELVTKALQV